MSRKVARWTTTQVWLHYEELLHDSEILLVQDTIRTIELHKTNCSKELLERNITKGLTL